MRYSGVEDVTPVPGDTGKQVEEIRRVVSKEVIGGGERIISMLATIQKDQRKSFAAHEEHRQRFARNEQDMAVLMARFADATNNQQASMRSIEAKVDKITEKVAYLDGEQTGIHSLPREKPSANDTGLSLSISQKVILALLSSGAGGLLTWIVGRLS